MGFDINFGDIQQANPFAAFNQGQEVAQKRRQDQARQAAGNVFATDPDQAAQILASSGDLGGAAEIQKIGASRKAAASRAKAAQLYSAGNVKGAQNEALSSGDSEFLTSIKGLSDEEATAAKERAQNIASVAYGLSKLPYEQRKAQIAGLAQHPEMTSALGLKPEDLAKFDPTDEAIGAVVSHSLGLAKQIELAKPIEMDPTKNYFVNDLAGGGGQSPGAAPQAAAATPASTPAAPTGAVYGQVAQIAQQSGAKPEEVSYLQRLAQVESSGKPDAQNGSSTGVFQFHPDTFRGLGGRDIHSVPEQTAAALAMSRHDRQNLQQIGVEPTDANVYIMHQQGAGGGRALLTADPNANAVQVLTPVYGSSATAQKAIVNNGGSLDMTAGQFTNMWRQRWSAQPQAPSTGATPTPPSMPGYHLVQQGGQQWKSDGKGVLINTATGDRKKDPSFQDGGPGAVDQNIVKGLLEGRIMPPTQKAAASDYWQAQLQAAAAQDPKFDMVDFGARAKTRADFTSGKSAQNITALNTVIGHLDHLDRTIDGLGNTGPGGALNFGPFNAVNNSLARGIAHQAGTDQRYKDFETAKTAVANELTRVFRGTGGAEADIQGWMKQLEGAGSPEALHGVVRSMAELINSRVEALGEQYGQGMGTTKDPLTLLTSDKAKSFQRLMGHEPQAATPAAKGGKAAHQMSDAELKAALGL